MKKISMLIGTLFLLVTMSPAAGQQLGDNATIIVPAGKITNLRQVLVVKGGPKGTATKVGDCVAGEVRFQDAQLIDREPPAGRGGRGDASGRGEAAGRGGAAASGLLPTIATEVAVIYPGAAGFKDLKPGWHLGSYRPGGKCGPGYDVYVAHIIAIE